MERAPVSAMDGTGRTSHRCRPVFGLSATCGDDLQHSESLIALSAAMINHLHGMQLQVRLAASPATHHGRVVGAVMPDTE